LVKDVKSVVKPLTQDVCKKQNLDAVMLMCAEKQSIMSTAYEKVIKKAEETSTLI